MYSITVGSGGGGGWCRGSHSETVYLDANFDFSFQSRDQAQTKNTDDECTTLDNHIDYIFHGNFCVKSITIQCSLPASLCVFFSDCLVAIST